MSTILTTTPENEQEIALPWALPARDISLEGDAAEDIEEFDDEDFDDDFDDDFEEEDDFDDDLPEELDEDELKKL